MLNFSTLDRSANNHLNSCSSLSLSPCVLILYYICFFTLGMFFLFLFSVIMSFWFPLVNCITRYSFLNFLFFYFFYCGLVISLQKSFYIYLTTLAVLLCQLCGPLLVNFFAVVEKV